MNPLSHKIHDTLLRIRELDDKKKVWHLQKIEKDLVTIGELLDKSFGVYNPKDLMITTGHTADELRIIIRNNLNSIEKMISPRKNELANYARQGYNYYSVTKRISYAYWHIYFNKNPDDVEFLCRRCKKSDNFDHCTVEEHGGIEETVWYCDEWL